MKDYVEWKSFIASKCDVPKAVTDEWILKKLNATKEEGFNFFTLWGFCYQDLRESDFSKVSKDLLLQVSFDSSTKWPNLLPSGFNPEAILKNKQLGYGFKEVHKLGITGKGVLVAVIDHPSNIDHLLIKDNIKEYIVLEKEYDCFHFHGLAVISRLCGKDIGIAPGVEVIFYAGQPLRENENEDDSYLIEYTIKCLKDIKRKILNKELIRIINMSNSWLHYGSDKLKKEASIIIDELEELGCQLIDSTNYIFRYVNCKGDENYNNIDNYTVPTFFQPDTKDRMNILSGGKLVASYLTKDEYKFGPVGSASYTIPQVVGFYALALQTNPNIKFDDFISICREKSVVNKNGLRIVNPLDTIIRIKEMM